MKKTNNLKIILKFLAVLCILPVVISVFFSGMYINTIGLSNSVEGVSIFEYAQKNDIFMAFTFVSIVLGVLLMIAILILSLMDEIKHTNNNFIIIMLCVFQTILAIMAFAMLMLYCINNTEMRGGMGVRYSAGAGSVIIFIFSLLFSIFTIVAYSIPEKKKK